MSIGEVLMFLNSDTNKTLDKLIKEKIGSPSDDKSSGTVMGMLKNSTACVVSNNIKKRIVTIELKGDMTSKSGGYADGLYLGYFVCPLAGTLRIRANIKFIPQKEAKNGGVSIRIFRYKGSGNSAKCSPFSTDLFSKCMELAQGSVVTSLASYKDSTHNVIYSEGQINNYKELFGDMVVEQGDVLIFFMNNGLYNPPPGSGSFIYDIPATLSCNRLDICYDEV